MRFLILSLFVLSTAPAFAALEPSEFFWRPATGQHAVTPSITYSHTEYKLKSTNATYRSNSRTVSLDYNYGVTDNFDIEIETAYANANYETSRVDGFRDIDFTGKFSSNLGTGRLVYGAALGISPGKNKEKSPDEYNAYSGGHSLTPMVGYEAHIAGGKMKAGGAVSYSINLGDSKSVDYNGDESKTSGGEALVLTGFFEGKINDMFTLGGAIAYATYSDLKDEGSGGTAKVEDTAAVSGYATAQIQENIALLGNIGVASSEDSDFAKEHSTIILGVGARFLF